MEPNDKVKYVPIEPDADDLKWAKTDELTEGNVYTVKGVNLFATQICVTLNETKRQMWHLAKHFVNVGQDKDNEV